MFDSYELPRVTHGQKFNWQARFYEALLDGHDPRENCFAAEWIVFTRLSVSEAVPLSRDEQGAMDDCLCDLRRFQMLELNYPAIETTALQNTDLRCEEELIEETFHNIVGRPMLMRERAFFLRKPRVA
jgi:hypothetical protein